MRPEIVALQWLGVLFIWAGAGYTWYWARTFGRRYAQRLREADRLTAEGERIFTAGSAYYGHLVKCPLCRTLNPYCPERAGLLFELGEAAAGRRLLAIHGQANKYDYER